jgi:hypothetical protein
VICFPLHLDRKLDNDDEVVLGGRSPTVNELLIAESSDEDNVVVEDIIEGEMMMMIWKMKNKKRHQVRAIQRRAVDP